MPADGGDDIEETDGKERRLFPNQAELAAIAEVRGLRAGGASLHQIADRMKEKGFPLSPTGVKRILDEWTNDGVATA